MTLSELSPFSLEVMRIFLQICFGVIIGGLIIVYVLDCFGLFDKEIGKSIVVQVIDFHTQGSWVCVSLGNILIEEKRLITDATVKIPKKIFEEKMRNSNPYAEIQFVKGIFDENFKFLGPAQFKK